MTDFLTNQSTPSTPVAPGMSEGRPWLDLGPRGTSEGCGIAATWWVPDRFGNTDLTPACNNHDVCSDALFERSDKPLGEVLSCQAGFFSDVYRAGGETFWGKVGGTVLSAVYGTAVSAVALGQWGVNRILDGYDAVASFASNLFS